MSLPLPLARHRADSPVFITAEGTLSAGQLRGLAAAIAARIPADADEVVLACEDRASFSAGLLASWHRGLPIVLPSHLSTRAVTRLAQRETTWVVHDLAEGRGHDVRSLRDALPDPADSLGIALEAESIAARVYTSGSSGEPTAHAKTLGQLLAEVDCWLTHFELTGARVVASVSPNHIYGLLFGVLLPLAGGGITTCHAPLMPGAVERAMGQLGANVWVAVPAHLRAVAESEHGNWLERCRVISSGAPLPPEVAGPLRARGVHIREVLGSTETGGIAQRDASDAPWTPLPGVRVSRADDAAQMSVDSPWLHPDEARPRVCADRIELLEGGRFRHLGRSDRVIKVAGRRVDLGHVESLLRRVPNVRDARVITVRSEGARGLTLWAAAETERCTPSELRQALLDELDPVTVPRRIRCVRALPRTAAGKVSESSVRALFDDEIWQLPAKPMENGVQLEVPASLGYFRGHFDGLPILPGVAQLASILRHARQRWPDLAALQQVTRAKFKAPLKPGDALELHMTRKPEGRVVYRLTRDGEDAATGTLRFAVHAAPQEAAP